VSTANGPRYSIVDGSGNEVKIEASGLIGSALLQATPRYMLKFDGIIYDSLVHSNPGQTGIWRVADPAQPLGGSGLLTVPDSLTTAHYARPVGKVSFKLN